QRLRERQLAERDCRTVRELQHEQAQRDDLHPGADGGHRETEPQHPKVAMAQRAKRLDALLRLLRMRCGGGHVRHGINSGSWMTSTWPKPAASIPGAIDSASPTIIQVSGWRKSAPQARVTSRGRRARSRAEKSRYQDRGSRKTIRSS